MFGKVGVVDFSGPGDRTDQALNIRSASICEEAFGNLAGREALDEVGAESLVLAVGSGGGFEEEGGFLC